MSATGDKDVLSDPVFVSLANAPVDDEDQTDAEHEAAERARRDIREGKTLSHDEGRRKLRRV